MRIGKVARLGMLGFGNMGRAIAEGIVSSKLLPMEAFSVFDLAFQTADRMTPFPMAESNAEVAEVSNALVLAVKPNQMEDVCAEIRGSLSAREQMPVVVSVAAGVPISAITGWLGREDLPVVRAMPNTPGLVREGITACFTNPHVTDEDYYDVHALLGSIGQVLRVDDEDQLDAVTAISGSGPAYFFKMVEELTLAGITLGLAPEVSEALAVQTARGAGMLVSKSDCSATELREQVSSPGGTTLAALEAMSSRGLEEAIVAGVRAAHSRSIELGKAAAGDVPPQSPGELSVFGGDEDQCAEDQCAEEASQEDRGCPDPYGF